MNVFRFFALPIVLIVLAMLFSGCGGGEDDSQPQPVQVELRAVAGQIISSAGAPVSQAVLGRILAAPDVASQRLRLDASVTGLRTTGVLPADGAGLRCIVMVNGREAGRAILSAATPRITVEVDTVPPGAQVILQVEAFITATGAPASLGWDEVMATLRVGAPQGAM